MRRTYSMGPQYVSGDDLRSRGEQGLHRAGTPLPPHQGALGRNAADDLHERSLRLGRLRTAQRGRRTHVERCADGAPAFRRPLLSGSRQDGIRKPGFHRTAGRAHPARLPVALQEGLQRHRPHQRKLRRRNPVQRRQGPHLLRTAEHLHGPLLGTGDAATPLGRDTDVHHRQQRNPQRRFAALHHPYPVVRRRPDVAGQGELFVPRR